MQQYPIRRLMVAVAGIGLMLAPVSAKADEFINVLTGGTSGVYYPLGVALTKIYGEKIPGARTQVQSTKASVENLNLLQKGSGEIAFALGDSVKLAWEGNEEAGFKTKLDKLRGIAAIYPNYIQLVASKASGITSLSDLKGKNLPVGAPKSGTGLKARAIFAAAGLSQDELAQPEDLTLAEDVGLTKDPQLAGTVQSDGLGVASIRDLSTSVAIQMVAVPSDVVEKLGAPYIAATIPVGTYTGQDADVPTVAVVNFLVTHDGVSEETAYQMTKQLFENLPEMVAAHTAAGAIKLENALKVMPVPLHPGAERYYKAKGLM